MAEREASGDFDYLWDDPAVDYGLTSDDEDVDTRPGDEIDQQRNDPGDDLWDEPGDNFWDNQPDPDNSGHFDAFNMTTWSFKPAPTPWYGTKQAVSVMVAAAAAAAAIVVSGVLLVFRGHDTPVEGVTASSVTPTAPTSAGPVHVASSQVPPPPPPPPPPPRTLAPSALPRPTLPGQAPAPPPPPAETAASPVNPVPVNRTPAQSRPTKAPEFGVTRTPVTRSPISVAPQPRFGHH